MNNIIKYLYELGFVLVKETELTSFFEYSYKAFLFRLSLYDNKYVDISLHHNATSANIIIASRYLISNIDELKFLILKSSRSPFFSK